MFGVKASGPENHNCTAVLSLWTNQWAKSALKDTFNMPEDPGKKSYLDLTH